jgi:hypothetical protein
MASKIYAKVLVLLAFICVPFVSIYGSCQNGQISEEGNVINCGKTYIQSDHIELIANTIFVKIDDLIYETPALYNDENGYYIMEVRASCGLIERKNVVMNAITIKKGRNASWQILKKD